MKKIIGILLVAVASLFLTSCLDEVRYESVPFEESRIYYCLQDPSAPFEMAFYSQGEFEKYYKPAISGSASMEQIVDFSNNFVVAVTDVINKNRRVITVKEVLLKESTLYVRYVIEDKGSVTFSVKPSVVASISRNYAGCEVAFQNITGMQ